MKRSITFAIATILIISLIACLPQESTIDVTEEVMTDQLETSDNQSVITSFEEAYSVVDQLPLFGGCDTKMCSDEKLIAYVHKNIDYPEEAKLACIEGRVYVQFVIEIDGSVTNIQLARDIGAGAGQAAVDVVESFNSNDIKWAAGMDEGKPVPVKFTLPISFKLS